MRILKENETILNTYTVECFLGEGAFAEVYRVKHRFLGRLAMKVLKRPVESAKEVESLLSEAILLSHLGHPNIVRIFDANAIETPRGIRGFFTMEHISGGTLDSFLHLHGNSLTLESIIEIACQICRGLAIAHSESPPIIHRDIKPQNILVGLENDGIRARISDFGLAKQVNPLTLLASAAGTLAFKPPEIFDDPASDSIAGDIYAVGVTIYLMLTGTLPYKLGDDLAHISQSNFNKSPRRPEELNLDVDPLLGDIVMRCLDRNPDARFPNAKCLCKELESWCQQVNNGFIQSSAMVREALRLAKDEAQLLEAADLMEKAISNFPSLKEKYSSRVDLWRAGISM